jgi:hypothetical protein
MAQLQPPRLSAPQQPPYCIAAQSVTQKPTPEGRNARAQFSQEIIMLAVLSHSLSSLSSAPSRDEPGFLALVGRIAQAVHAERQRRRDAQIAAFIEARGGRITDDLERQIGNYFC